MTLLGGCSALRVSYDRADTLVGWWLDRRVDFDSAQEAAVRQSLRDWLTWHRATQLTDYAQSLAALRPRLAGPLAPDEICAVAEAWQQRLQRAAEAALPAAARHARGLRPAQLDRLELRLREDLEADEQEQAPADARRRHEQAVARWVERAERLYGRLDARQRALLADAIERGPWDARRWIAERRARQQDLLRDWRAWQQAGAAEAVWREGLRQQMAALWVSPRPAYRAHAAQLRQADCALMARLHDSTTTAQRERARERLQGWEDDLRQLAAGPVDGESAPLSGGR
ncbi:MAG: hypothetical protein RIQ53_1339 [Pseudomonadota bacterium]